jgi:ferredoxin--NADP+ reductase
LPNEVIKNNQPVIFVATGTGISPLRSIILSNPELDYTVLHGVRYKYEAYNKEDYATERFVLCSSKENGTGYKGRVTDYLKENDINKKTLYYLCGNSAMVDEATEILEEKGLSPDNIKTEVFF